MENKNYAYLPEDLLLQMLNDAPATVKKLHDIININEEQIQKARNILENSGFIKICSEGETTDSIMAADGANIINSLSSADMVLAIAVGVDGLTKEHSANWPEKARQYQQWQDVLPHHVANSRLTQGIMFLMELSILAGTDREIRIMDGSHITSILKLNSLLTAHGAEQADKPYVDSLANFLHKNYKKIIPDIPDIITAAFSQEEVISLTKYSSSREIIDSQLQRAGLEIIADDKVFMSSVLRENEYTNPTPVGQSSKDKKMWADIHIRCNLPIDGVDIGDLSRRLDQAIEPFKIKNNRDSELFFCYYKPLSNTMAYRLEVKKSLAENTKKFEYFMRSLKKQIIFPEIREPYPQFFADIIAKNIHFGMEAVSQAVLNNQAFHSVQHLDLVSPYRTN